MELAKWWRSTVARHPAVSVGLVLSLLPRE